LLRRKFKIKQHNLENISPGFIGQKCDGDQYGDRKEMEEIKTGKEKR
jgi:hypothetical protein